MRAWSTSGDDGAVRVQGPHGEVLGSGFLIDTRRVLTCAHVIEGLSEVGLVFRVDPAAGVHATKVTLRSFDGKGQDLAILELEEEPPVAARPLRLAKPTPDGRFRALGFPERYDEGLWIRGALAGPDLRGWWQIEPDGARDVVHGFSGGAAWSDDAKAAVGMIVARSGKRVAWLIPTLEIARTLPDLPTPSGPRLFRTMAQPPVFYVPRAEYSLALQALATSVGRAVALTTALAGAGGFGKTTLAQALATDPAIREVYPEGVLWITMGESLRPADRLARIRDLLRFWADEEPPAFETANAAGAALREALSGHSVLVVVDDVWDPADLSPFHGLGGETCLLVTTRDSRNLSPGTLRLEVDAMARDEAVAVLAAGLPPQVREEQRERLQRLAHRLGGWPLLLSLVNGQLTKLLADHLDTSAALDDIEQALDAQGLEVFDRTDSSSRRDAVSRTLGASLDRLSEDERSRLFTLAAFAEDADVPVSIVASFWGLSVIATKRVCERLRDLSLLSDLDRVKRTLRLHDVIRAYLIEHSPAPAQENHRRLLSSMRPSSGKWSDIAAEPLYPWRHIASHLFSAGQRNELRELIFDIDWMKAKLSLLGMNALLADFSSLATDPECSQLRAALVLSAHVLGREPGQLPAQLMSRLTPAPGHLSKLLENCRKRGGLLHIHPGPVRPGGPLLRTIAEVPGIIRVAALNSRYVVVSGSDDGVLRIWDIESAEPVHVLEGHSGVVRSVLPLGTNKFLSGGDDTTLRLWDVLSGETLFVYEGHQGSIVAIAALDDRRIISASRDCTLRSWDISNGECLQVVRTPYPSGALAAICNQYALLGVGSTVQLINVDIDDADIETTHRTFQGHTGEILAVAAIDDECFVTASADGTLRLWNLNDNSRRVLIGHSGEVEAVTVAGEGHLISGSRDGTLRLWHSKTGKCVKIIEGHTRPIHSVTALDQERILSASYDGTMLLWDLTKYFLDNSGHQHTGEIRDLMFFDQRRVVSASADGTLRLWDIEDGRTLQILSGHSRGVWSVAMLDQRRVLSGSTDGALRLWDLDDGQSSVLLKEPGGWIEAVVGITSGIAVVSVGSCCLKVIDVHSKEELRILEGHEASVRCIEVLDGKHIVSGSADRTLRVWDVMSGANLVILEGHESAVRDIVAVSTSCVLSASANGIIRLWDLNTAECVRIYAGHMESVSALGLIGDGLFVSASEDQTLRVWELKTGKLLSSTHLEAPVRSLATHGPSRTVVAGDAFGNIRFMRYYEPDT